ncbi:TIGR00375 family protein [Candidatus Micrarchaeota archaeon]|nr:TIGR00375 family protein [Candidatus Micrarchaeota archaeon]MBU1929948.1 TIGR00375 family protein [Candidatus Micrarchaeota archaeon]
MKTFNCDLHIHGSFAGGVSKYMRIPVIAEQARLKGLEVVTTGDVQHANWLQHLKQNLVESSNGIFQDHNQTIHFLLQTEIEDNQRLHHLIFLPDFSHAQEFRDKTKKFGILDCSMCGRPKLRLNAEQIAEITLDSGGIIGPAHAFTPYTGLFSKHDSIAKAYDNMAKHISFLELGLSADSDLADRIASNHQYTFLSNSDSHSPWPHRIGREFNRIQLKEPSFKELKKALQEKTEKRIVLNAGLDPREGKYHETACNQCFFHYTPKDAIQFKWQCPSCKGQIKKGVRDRILELADTEKKAPSYRPPYLHLIPLAEIIQQGVGVENVLAKKVQSKWKDWIERFENEINILVDVPEQEILEFDKTIGGFILAFRNERVHYLPGGGGDYGKPLICLSQEEFESKKNELQEKQNQKNRFKGQKTLGQF